MSKTFYITTTLPYINAPLHLGHATEIIRADAVARQRQLCGDEVFFNTGTDEHGLKVYEAAAKAGKDVQQYVDEYAALYKNTLRQFGVTDEAHYIRTTTSRHLQAAQEFWRRCNQNGYIYKKNYQTKYCVGCEEEKTDSQLVDGKCPEHDRVPELINEENYFFKLSAFGDKLSALYDAHPDFIIPAYRLNELREFIKNGLRDFSISRLATKMPWGIPVPDDPTQVMYVWFDALVNYISTLGWGSNTSQSPLTLRGEEDLFEKFWAGGTPTQYCGKDNIRFQGLMWQAMLMAAGLPPTHTIIVDGFILGEGGVKMSKTLGNVIDPLAIVQEYGTDALRYFVLRHFHPFEDTTVSPEKLKEWYNAHLANGLGNLVSRVLTMAITNNVRIETEDTDQAEGASTGGELDNEWYQKFELNKMAEAIWQTISEADNLIQVKQPFKLIKTNKSEAEAVIRSLLATLLQIGTRLRPLLPQTAETIISLVTTNQLPAPPLFPRKD